MNLLYSKKLVALGIIAFVVMSFWSLSSVSFNMHGEMAGCPFMNGVASLCGSDLFLHISMWKELFTLTKLKNLIPSLFIILAYASLLTFVIGKYQKENNLYNRFLINFYKYRPEINLFNKIRLAFSQGIIHPTIYA